MRLHFLGSTLVRGGAETVAAALSRRLAARGHAVAWTLLREPGAVGTELAGSVDLVHSVAPGRGPGRGWLRLRERLEGVEGLYVLDHVNAVIAGAVAGLGRGGLRAVAIHTTGLYGGRPSLDRRFRLALSRYDRVLALSPTHARYLTGTERVAADKVRVVPNGIDLDRFAGLPGRAEARARLGVPGDAEVVGTVAVLRPEKDLGRLVDAAAALRASRPRMVLCIAGDGPERDRLRARASRAGEAIRFLGQRTDVPDLLPALDLFVLSSLPQVETQPLAVLEAMAAGVPVLATRVGDLEEMLEGGASGRLVPPGDTGALEEGIAALLDDGEARRRLAERGRERVKDYSLDAAADRLMEVLGEGAR